MPPLPWHHDWPAHGAPPTTEQRLDPRQLLWLDLKRGQWSHLVSWPFSRYWRFPEIFCSGMPGDFWLGCSGKQTWCFSFSMRSLREKMDGTTALIVMTFSPCVKSVASPNGFKISTKPFNRFHSRAVNDNSLCPAFSRTAQSFRWLHWITAFTCLSVAPSYVDCSRDALLFPKFSIKHIIECCACVQQWAEFW